MNHPMTDGRIGRRVRAARKAAKMTQVELGRRIGLDGTEVWKLEAGRKGLRIWRLKAIAHALGVTVDSLLVDVSIKPPPVQRAG